MFGRKFKTDAQVEVPDVGQNIAPYWEIITEQDSPDAPWEWVAYHSQPFQPTLRGDGHASRDEAFEAAKTAIRNVEHRKASRRVDIITRIQED